MRERLWPSMLIIVAFVISLVHSSIPHSHPEKEKKGLSSSTHSHSKNGHESHSHGEGNHDPSKNEKSLPVFVHFSNADYISNYSFHLKEDKGQFLIAVIKPSEIILSTPEEIEKQIIFPRARDLPAGRHRTPKSLRAPPIFS